MIGDRRCETQNADERLVLQHTSIFRPPRRRSFRWRATAAVACLGSCDAVLWPTRAAEFSLQRVPPLAARRRRRRCCERRLDDCRSARRSLATRLLRFCAVADRVKSRVARARARVRARVAAAAYASVRMPLVFGAMRVRAAAQIFLLRASFLRILRTSRRRAPRGRRRTRFVWPPWRNRRRRRASILRAQTRSSRRRRRRHVCLLGRRRRRRSNLLRAGARARILHPKCAVARAAVVCDTQNAGCSRLSVDQQD